MGKKHAFFHVISFAVCLCFVFSLSGCLHIKKKTVIARLGSETVTEEQYRLKVESLPREIRSVVLRNKKDFAEDMARERMLLKEAENRNLQRLPDVKSLLQAAREKIVIAKLIDLEVDKKLTLGQDEASAYYEAHKEDFMTPELVRASHILVKKEEDAHAIKKELETGADFEEMARAKSIDMTAMRGGDLGFFQKGQLVPEFEEVAFRMKKGELSDVFRTQFGYHIVKVTDRMEPRLREFRSVKAAIEERLLKEKRSRIFKEFVEKLKGNRKIEVNEKALESIKL